MSELVEEMLAALKEALALAILANELTGCRGDDDYVWGVQAKIHAAILKAEPDFTMPRSPFRADA